MALCSPARRHTSPAVVALDEKREEVDDGVSEAGRSGELTDICLVTDGEEKGVPGAAAVFKGPAKGPHPTWLRLSSSSYVLEFDSFVGRILGLIKKIFLLCLVRSWIPSPAYHPSA
jgi:hypothetical protein